MSRQCAALPGPRRCVVVLQCAEWSYQVRAAHVSPLLAEISAEPLQHRGFSPYCRAKYTLGGARVTPRHHARRTSDEHGGKRAQSICRAVQPGTGGDDRPELRPRPATPPHRPGTPAPPRPRASASSRRPDELPSPLEDKRRELREEALTKVLNGTAKAEKRGASTVVKVGSKADGRRQGRQERHRAKVDQYVELTREKTDRIFVVLAEFGNERHPDYPDQDTDPAHPRPGDLRRPAAQRDPGAGPVGGQLDRLAGRTTTGSTSRTCTSAPARTR